MSKNSQQSSPSPTELANTIRLIVEEFFGPVVKDPIKRFKYDLENLYDRVEKLETEVSKKDPREVILQDLEILEGRIKRIKQVL